MELILEKINFLMKKNSFGVLEFGEKTTDLNFDSFEIMKTKKNIKIEISFCKKNITYFLPNNFSISTIFNFIKVGLP